jgi:hypothetical protein
MTEQILYYIIIALVGIIIGGTGGAALFRRVSKGTIPNHNDAESVADVAAVVASTASSTAAVVAATATSVAANLRTEISSQISAIQLQLADNSDKLNDLKVVITGFMGACPEKHRAIEQRFDAMEKRRISK